MTTRGAEGFVTGVYRCKDPIKNLKIKVKLEQEKTTLIPLPDFEYQPIEKTADKPGKGTECEEKLISWQEKIFSPFEISHYSCIGNKKSSTPLEEKYHNEVTALLKNCVPSSRIFTYTDADNFIETDEVGGIIPDKIASSILVKGMECKRQIGHSKLPINEISFPNYKIIDYNPTEESVKKKHFLTCSYIYFYILADLSKKESFSEREDWSQRSEYLLCTIKYDVHSKILLVTPDFTTVSLNGQPAPYYIEVDGDSRNVYKYWLEHSSEAALEENLEKDEIILNQFIGHHLDIQQMKIGTDFEVPRSNLVMIYIIGEVVCAECFDCDDLFVHFLYELPKGWRCDSQEQLMGATQKCRANNAGMVYFGHLFETHLTLNVESLPAEAENVPSWPQLFAEVLSFDSWGRFSVEGYCFIKLPATPGQHYFTLHTWRPQSRGPIGELRRYFVGGSPCLEDLSSVGIPATFEGDRLSKYGLETIGNGILHLRLNIVLQSSANVPTTSEMDSGDTRHQPSFLLERISATSIVKSVNSIMAAFKKARGRMLLAKEGLED